jgi:hypothetical protein
VESHAEPKHTEGKKTKAPINALFPDDLLQKTITFCGIQEVSDFRVPLSEKTTAKTGC